ncbi:hypothetical protein ACQ4LF_25275, partial [Aeromonas salmonicida]
MLLALCLSILPLPFQFEPFRPDWLAMVLIYWALAAAWLATAWQAEQTFEERPVAELAERYTDYLHACKRELG